LQDIVLTNLQYVITHGRTDGQPPNRMSPAPSGG